MGEIDRQKSKAFEQFLIELLELLEALKKGVEIWGKGEEKTNIFPISSHILKKFQNCMKP